MMKAALALATLGAVTVPQSTFAHHSFAMFDNSKELEVRNATVLAWQRTSPRAWLYVVTPNGTKYRPNGGNPGALRRVGYPKGSFAPGDKVTVYMSPLRNGRPGGALPAAVLPGGKMLGKRLKVS